MWKNSKIASSVLTALVLLHIIWSCQNIEPAPLVNNSEKVLPELSFNELILSETKSSSKVNAVNVPAPTVTKITSKASCDNCVSNTSVLIPWVGQQNEISIIGTNFGASNGKSILITDLNGKTQATYSFGFLSWTDTAIRLATGASLSAIPMGLKIVITTADNRVVTTTLNVTPLISGKLYGTELYFINKKRIEMKFQPLPYGLYISGTALDANYSPSVGNVWLYPSIAKQSIVVSVRSRTVLISSNKAGSVEDLIYDVGTAEWVNDKEVNSSRQITIRRTTTVFTNGTKRYYYELKTPVNSAFNSIIKGQTAIKYYK